MLPGFNQHCRELMCLAQGHNTVTHVGIEPRTARFGVLCSTTTPPRKCIVYPTRTASFNMRKGAKQISHVHPRRLHYRTTFWLLVSKITTGKEITNYFFIIKMSTKSAYIVHLEKSSPFLAAGLKTSKYKGH